MRRFQSGTLGRSVRRFGRFPSSSRSFKRKSHSWKYVVLDEQNVNRSAGSTLVVTLFDKTDFQGVASAGLGCKNVVLDLALGLTWSPEVTTLAYDSWAFRLGVWCRDEDDATAAINTQFADGRAIWWQQHAHNSAEQPTALGEGCTPRQVNWRARARQRFVKFDEELVFMAAFNGAVDSTIADARMWIFGRMSWETP